MRAVQLCLCALLASLRSSFRVVQVVPCDAGAVRVLRTMARRSVVSGQVAAHSVDKRASECFQRRSCLSAGRALSRSERAQSRCVTDCVCACVRLLVRDAFRVSVRGQRRRKRMERHKSWRIVFLRLLHFCRTRPSTCAFPTACTHCWVRGRCMSLPGRFDSRPFPSHLCVLVVILPCCLSPLSSGAFAHNTVGFHHVDADARAPGYRLVAQQVLAIDAFNPSVASRLVRGWGPASAQTDRRKTERDQEKRELLISQSARQDVWASCSGGGGVQRLAEA